ncbi:MAG: hypothetical protein AAGI01_06295 [Myxococcota bacterium]
MSVSVESPTLHRLTRQEIVSVASRLANTLPDAPADAPRARRSLPIASLVEAGARYWRLVLRAQGEEALLDSFRLPGQYTTLQWADLEPRYLVIAEGPSRTRQGRALEFLLDRDSSLGQALRGASVGDVVGVSPAEGPGWELGDLLGCGEVWAFASGSGIATMRSVWRELEHQWPERAERFALFYGEHERDDFVYAHEQRALAQRGATVRRAWSAREAQDPGPRFVQQALDRAAPDEGVHVLLSGAPQMIEAVAEHVLGMGVPPECISLNV